MIEEENVASKTLQPASHGSQLDMALTLSRDLDSRRIIENRSMVGQARIEVVSFREE